MLEVINHIVSDPFTTHEEMKTVVTQFSEKRKVELNLQRQRRYETILTSKCTPICGEAPLRETVGRKELAVIPSPPSMDVPRRVVKRKEQKIF